MPPDGFQNMTHCKGEQTAMWRLDVNFEITTEFLMACIHTYTLLGHLQTHISEIVSLVPPGGMIV